MYPLENLQNGPPVVRRAGFLIAWHWQMRQIVVPSPEVAIPAYPAGSFTRYAGVSGSFVALVN
jgi:hypothetical protein